VVFLSIERSKKKSLKQLEIKRDGDKKELKGVLNRENSKFENLNYTR